MKIFLDDVRPTPEGWTHCFWPEEVIDLINIVGLENITHISLDHDLGCDEHGTGYDVIEYIEQLVAFNIYPLIPIILVHSANTSARQKMEAGIDAIERIFFTKHDYM